MTPDPDFPDRPEHAEFDRLARIVHDHDSLVDDVAHEDRDSAFESHVRKIIPLEVLFYVAAQRGLRVTMMEGDPLATVSASWIDGFMAGAQYRQETAQISLPLARTLVLEDEEITACRAYGVDEKSETMIHGAGVVELHEDCKPCQGLHEILMQSMSGPLDDQD